MVAWNDEQGNKTQYARAHTGSESETERELI